MPNAANIERPVILVGQGRSGTSLVASLFSHHPDCAAVGETGNVIFGVWSALRLSVANVTPLIEHGRTVPDDERAGRLVRQAFLTTFPDDRADWMQKPIGVPRALGELFGDERGGDESASMFWRVLGTSFPGARYITVLRHPCDVVLSGVAHWGKDARTLWRSLADLARFLLHADAPAIHPIVYERLVRDQEPTVRAMCEATGVPFDARMLGAFDQIHVAAPGRREPVRTSYSRRHEWASLDPTWVMASERAAITALFARFGQEDLDWPDGFGAAGDETDAPVPDAERIVRLGALLKEVKRNFERARFEYADQSRTREQEFARVWAEQRDWIAELERAKTWLEGQVQNWRAEAERLQQAR